jgi:hypothetical protein
VQPEATSSQQPMRSQIRVLLGRERLKVFGWLLCVIGFPIL